MPLSEKYDEALLFASILHRDQVRKGSDIPYISHLMSVSALVLEHGGDEEQAIAALLHDAVEDQGGTPVLEEIRRRFGDDVAGIVEDCTDAWVEPKPPWQERKEAYIAKLPSKDQRSLLVSLADKTHNARAIYWDYQEDGDRLWDRFKGGRDGTLWYYRTLSAIFTDTILGSLNREFRETVEALHEAAGEEWVR